MQAGNLHQRINTDSISLCNYCAGLLRQSTHHLGKWLLKKTTSTKAPHKNRW
jgi:hypothetical protein